MMALKVAAKVLLLMGLFFVSRAEARSVSTASEKTAFARADAVYEVAISQRSAGIRAAVNCGVVYTVAVHKVLKGRTPGPVFEFGFLDGLEVGHAYTVYLVSSRNTQLMRGLLQSRATNDSQIASFVESCPGWDFYFFQAKRTVPAETK
ncbi:hypothetical protein ACWYXN_05865 [Janthinobacterium aestuarii]